MATQPKAHHFVPRALLRPFADEEEKLWHYNKRRDPDRISRQHIDNVFFRNQLYSLRNDDGSRNVTLEIAYSHLEDRIAPLFAHITSAVIQHRLPQLTNSERDIIRFFVHQQWRRVPELFERVMPKAQAKAEIAEVLDDFEERFRLLTAEERQLYQSDNWIKQFWHDAKVRALANPSPKIHRMLSEKNIAFGVAPASRSFIVASQPVQKIIPAKTPNNLDHPNVEVWLAIHPRVVIALAATQHTEMIVSVGDKTVRDYNRKVAAASTEFASTSEALVKTLGTYIEKGPL